MKKKSVVCIALLCFMVSLAGVGCASRGDNTNSQIPDTQIAENSNSSPGNDTQVETGECTLQTVIIQKVTEDSIEVEHIILLNSNLEKDLQTLKEMNIPPEEYQNGYYRKDSGEIHTYDVDSDTSVTIYDVSQKYSESENRQHTFETYQEFVTAVQANEDLLISPYTLTFQDGVVTKIEEKFYN